MSLHLFSLLNMTFLYHSFSLVPVSWYPIIRRYSSHIYIYICIHVYITPFILSSHILYHSLWFYLLPDFIQSLTTKNIAIPLILVSFVFAYYKWWSIPRVIPGFETVLSSGFACGFPSPWMPRRCGEAMVQRCPWVVVMFRSTKTKLYTFIIIYTCIIIYIYISRNMFVN